jgi:predicted nucleic acid-binding Zn ribbon protein
LIVKKATSPGTESLTDVLGQLFVSRGWGRLAERARLEEAWKAAAGPAIAAESRVLAIRRGVLEVEVRSSVLMQELAQFHKRKLLKDLREKLPNLTLGDLKFRSGSW